MVSKTGLVIAKKVLWALMTYNEMVKKVYNWNINKLKWYRKLKVLLGYHQLGILGQKRDLSAASAVHDPQKCVSWTASLGPMVWIPDFSETFSFSLKLYDQFR